MPTLNEDRFHDTFRDKEFYGQFRDLVQGSPTLVSLINALSGKIHQSKDDSTYFDASDDRIHISVSYLDFSLFLPSNQLAQRLGALAQIVAHELVHGLNRVDLGQFDTPYEASAALHGGEALALVKGEYPVATELRSVLYTGRQSSG